MNERPTTGGCSGWVDRDLPGWPNKFPGVCAGCGKEIEPFEGVVINITPGDWITWATYC